MIGTRARREWLGLTETRRLSADKTFISSYNVKNKQHNLVVESEREVSSRHRQWFADAAANSDGGVIKLDPTTDVRLAENADNRVKVTKKIGNSIGKDNTALLRDEDFMILSAARPRLRTEREQENERERRRALLAAKLKQKGGRVPEELQEVHSISEIAGGRSSGRRGLDAYLADRKTFEWEQPVAEVKPTVFERERAQVLESLTNTVLSPKKFVFDRHVW